MTAPPRPWARSCPTPVAGSTSSAATPTPPSPGGSGAFTITTTLTAASGASLQATTQANVSVIPLTLTGQLNPASDSGLSNQDGITNVTQPNFNGTSEPGAVVTLVAQPLGGGSAFQIAQTTTNSSGFWSVNSSHALQRLVCHHGHRQRQLRPDDNRRRSCPRRIRSKSTPRRRRSAPSPSTGPPARSASSSRTTWRASIWPASRLRLFVHERGREARRQPGGGRHGATTLPTGPRARRCC